MACIFLLFIFIVLVVNAPKLARRKGGEAITSSIPAPFTTWLKAHPEFGTPLSDEPVSPWFKGSRHRIRTSTGHNLLLVEKAGQVMTVFDDSSGTRVKVWGEYENYGDNP